MAYPKVHRRRPLFKGPPKTRNFFLMIDNRRPGVRAACCIINQKHSRPLVLFAVHQGRCVTIAPTTGNDVKKRGHWAELMNYRKADIVSAARRMAVQNSEVIN
jgi:hypothetical protein